MCKVTLFDNLCQMALIGSFFLNVLKGLSSGLLKGLGLNIGSTASNAADMGLASLFRRSENAHLSGKEQEQNMFNAKQAALQRDFATSEREASQEFNNAQAERQMAFQEYMAGTQYQRSVADMQAAGVNPALSMGGIQGASASGAMATSSPASGASAAGSSQLQGLSDLLEFAALKSQIDKTKAETAKTNAETNKAEAETEGIEIGNIIAGEYGPKEADAKIRQIDQAISESVTRCGEISTASALNEAMAELTRVQKNSEEFKQAEIKWRKEFIERWDMPPELAGDLIKAAATLAGAGLVSAGKLIEVLKSPKGTITRKTKVPAGEVVVTKPLR